MNYANQLKSIINASGWSQELLARQLKVSFPTLNSWINSRSNPRKNALLEIDRLYLDIVGVDSVEAAEVQYAKERAIKLKTTPKILTNEPDVLSNLTLYLTYHTNTIEGSTMTLADVGEVIFDHKVLINRTAVEQAEARNHQAALLWTLEQLTQKGKNFTIDEDYILNIHLRLMNGIMGDAGQYRKHSVRIMGAHVPLANWQKIPELISDLVKMINHPSKDIINDLAKTHATFEKIHPFSDGNGRTGRLLLLTQALQSGLVPPLIEKERKYAYYKYLEMSQTKDIHEPLELFIAQAIESCYRLLKLNGRVR